MRTPAATPRAIYMVTTDVPPYENSGSVTPTTGNMPRHMRMFWNDWNMNMPAMPTVMSAEKVGRPGS